METRTAKYHQYQIGYRVSGTGHPVMLLHGFGEDSNIWADQVSALNDNFRVYVPDLPGTGLSAEAMQAEKAWTMEKFASAIREIAIQEHLNTFSLIGHSMGGYITLAFAEAYPRMLNGFGLVNSSSYADNEEKITARKKGIEFIQSNGALKFLEQLIPNLYGDQYKSTHSEDITKHLEAVKNFSASSLVSYYTAMMIRPDRRHLLMDAQKPVLFIIGAEDKTVNLSDSMSQCHLPQESHVTLLETSAHMGMREESHKTTLSMNDFLRRLNEN
jgi:pimeloyl-ACP methyl ester carboxylesterase